MDRLVAKYARKLRRAGLCRDALVAGLDDELVWNRAAWETDANSAGTIEILAGLFERMNIAGLVFGRPDEPLATIMDWLVREYPRGFTPRDTETRTFLHEIPVVREFTAEAMAGALARSKSVVVAGQGVAAQGSVTPEQAFVTFSSVCFSCFVLFFSEYLQRARQGRVDPALQDAFDSAAAHLSPMRGDAPKLMRGPFADRESLLAAMAEAGRATVDYGLVDSYFGNISCLDGGTLFISQTGSSLDELEGCIDPCPLDGSGTACLTASSELSAHMGVYERAGGRTILHGHPRFTVILSMDCPDYGGDSACDIGKTDLCHIKCTRKRYLSGSGLEADVGEEPKVTKETKVSMVPIVPGEVGTGPHGLCNTLPPVMRRAGAAAVWGHGLFTHGEVDFNQPFARLLGIENGCRRDYFRLVAEAKAKHEGTQDV